MVFDLLIYILAVLIILIRFLPEKDGSNIFLKWMNGKGYVAGIAEKGNKERTPYFFHPKTPSFLAFISRLLLNTGANIYSYHKNYLVMEDKREQYIELLGCQIGSDAYHKANIQYYDSFFFNEE